MEILRERPHHAVLTMKLATGAIIETDFISKMILRGYPKELTGSFIKSALKLKNDSAGIEITPSGKPDFHCFICLSLTLKPPCQGSGRDPATSLVSDNQQLNSYKLKTGQIITREDIKEISKGF